MQASHCSRTSSPTTSAEGQPYLDTEAGEVLIGEAQVVRLPLALLLVAAARLAACAARHGATATAQLPRSGPDNTSRPALDATCPGPAFLRPSPAAPAGTMRSRTSGHRPRSSRDTTGAPLPCTVEGGASATSAQLWLRRRSPLAGRHSPACSTRCASKLPTPPADR
jgi:hypothetical protein